MFFASFVSFRSSFRQGYTVTDRIQIRNDKIGFIQVRVDLALISPFSQLFLSLIFGHDPQDGMRFPWQEARAQMASVRELPMAQVRHVLSHFSLPNFSRFPQ